jgi:hypothetical protein
MQKKEERQYQLKVHEHIKSILECVDEERKKQVLRDIQWIVGAATNHGKALKDSEE